VLVQERFLCHFPYLGRAQGVIKEVPRGPTGPQGRPLELNLAALVEARRSSPVFAGGARRREGAHGRARRHGYLYAAHRRCSVRCGAGDCCSCSVAGNTAAVFTTRTTARTTFFTRATHARPRTRCMLALL
jgi:hypothetical protein